MDDEKITSAVLKEEDLVIDKTLRPKKFAEFVGQAHMKECLNIFIKASMERSETLDHILFFGPPGLGKTTMAHIIASELGVNMKHTSGPALERPADLAGILTGLEERDVLFIDEIHRLGHVVEEFLYPAMEDYVIDILIDKGPAARSVRLSLPRFTLIGATTRSGLLTSPLRERFGITHRLEYYSADDLYQIVMRSANILGVSIDSEGAREIAVRSRGTPRIANRLLKRVRDYAQVKADNKIVREVADQGLKMLRVDERGLDEMDRAILKCILEKFSGGPVGISTLAVSLQEDAETIEEVYEPYLISQGYIQRTPSGRKITKIGCDYLGYKPSGSKQREIWES